MTEISNLISKIQCKHAIYSNETLCRQKDRCEQTDTPHLACPCIHPKWHSECKYYEERIKKYTLMHDDHESIIEIFNSLNEFESFMKSLYLEIDYR